MYNKLTKFVSYISHCFRTKSQIISFTVDLGEKCAAYGRNDTVDLDLMSELETLFRSPACINASFLHENAGNSCCTHRYSGVNLSLAEQAFNYIRNLENESLKQVVSFAAAVFQMEL